MKYSADTFNPYETRLRSYTVIQASLILYKDMNQPASNIPVLISVYCDARLSRIWENFFLIFSILEKRNLITS